MSLSLSFLFDYVKCVHLFKLIFPEIEKVLTLDLQPSKLKKIAVLYCMRNKQLHRTLIVKRLI